MKQALTVVLLIALVSTFAWSSERSNEKPTSFDNPLMVAGPALDGTMATLDESFEGTFPPAGWVKFSPDGGTGWEQITVGTTPLPGWNGGVATAPPAANPGTAMAYATWTTGGLSSNEQWLVSTRITGDEKKVLKGFRVLSLALGIVPPPSREPHGDGLPPAWRRNPRRRKQIRQYGPTRQCRRCRLVSVLR